MTKLSVALIVAALGINACQAAPARPPAPRVARDEGGAAAAGQPHPEAEPASKPAEARVELGDGVAIASRWLDALAKSDMEALSRQTGFPFRVHYAVAKGDCPSHSAAATPAELSSVITCLTSDATLISVLQTHSGGGFDALTHADVQPWAKQWQAELRPELRLVTAYFERGDATVELDLVVADDGVRGLWKADGLDATVEARLATEWLSALRSGDVSSLAHATQYPFELRDRGRSSTCGARTVAGEEALDGAVRCLTSNELLLQAMRDSPEVPPVVYRSSDQLPGWARAWWEKQATPAVKVVTFLVATQKGDEFDLLFLVDKSGVHALWKSGSFESTD